jgi:hypothetical protein
LRSPLACRDPFLDAFDPVLRKELGVWYTPGEIVDYQVERVDMALRQELGIADGLADPRVVVLDACCGTAAYERAVLLRIAKTLRDKGEDGLVGQELKRAAMERIFGFEILPAPFVIAHLQIGLLLQSLGAPFSDERHERAAIFLTNALTGWEPPKDPKTRLLFPELEEERDAADKVKQQARILVVLGNPPHNGFAGVAVEEERSLSDAYRTPRRAPPPQGQGLNDLYVRFFRMAERKIVEQTGQGIICFISNYSWLDGLSFPGMRERFLDVFDSLWIDCLNGDKYKTGKLTPQGEPDPSVFSTEFSREGIQVGTAIALLVKRKADGPAPSRSESNAAGRLEGAAVADRDPVEPASAPGGGDAAPPSRVQAVSGQDEMGPAPPRTVRFRHFWGKGKHAELAAETACFHPEAYAEAVPVPELGLSFMPAAVAAGYVRWPTLPELLPVSFPGVKTSRDDFLVAIDRPELEQRLADYFNPDLGHEEIARRYPGAMASTARFNARGVREHLLKRGGPLPDRIVPYAYRPFDVRWLYWEPETDLLDRKREEYFPQVFAGNVWVEARQKQPMEAFDRGGFVHHLADNLGNGLSSYFPLLLQAVPVERDLFSAQSATPTCPQPNLSLASKAYLAVLGLAAETLLHHILAVLHAPSYRSGNAGALRQDWPRIPVPGWPVPDPAKVCEFRKLLEASATLGRQVAALLDTETPVPGVTGGDIRPELSRIARVARVDGRPMDPDAGDFDLTVGWGHAGQGGVTMPGRGRTVAHDGCLDVYLNDVACWRDIPAAVWDYTLGGYQVIKKWLSYREKALLGRGLTLDEVRYVTETARRIAALLALQGALDASYQRACAGNVART